MCTRRTLRSTARTAALLAPFLLGTLAPGPLDAQRPVVVQTRADGWLGLSVQEEIGVGRDSTWTGITVLRVALGGPSQRAGLQTGDRVVEVNGQPAIPALFNRVASSLAPGQSMHLRVRRDGDEREMVVTAAPHPAGSTVFLSRELAAEVDSKLRRLDSLRLTLSRGEGTLTGVVVGPGSAPPDLRATVLTRGDSSHVTMRLDSETTPSPLLPYVEGLHWVGGARFTPLNEDLAAYFQVEGGLLVTDVIPGTILPEAGVRPGDVVEAVGGRRVLTLDPVRAALAVRSDRDVVLSIVRHGESRAIRVPRGRR
ncbi:MAG: PDZ domain-containing protein [Gemmatimonadota bacterium]|jgi:predicted metalloprotease with PDZ domain